MSAPDRVVWKYAIPLRAIRATHDIPSEARFLHAAEQSGGVALWYEIPDPAAPPVRHDFRLFGTGVETIPDKYSYLGTTLHYQGTLILHVYEADR